MLSRRPRQPARRLRERPWLRLTRTRPPRAREWATSSLAHPHHSLMATTMTSGFGRSGAQKYTGLLPYALHPLHSQCILARTLRTAPTQNRRARTHSWPGCSSLRSSSPLPYLRPLRQSHQGSCRCPLARPTCSYRLRLLRRWRWRHVPHLHHRRFAHPLRQNWCRGPPHPSYQSHQCSCRCHTAHTISSCRLRSSRRLRWSHVPYLRHLCSARTPHPTRSQGLPHLGSHHYLRPPVHQINFPHWCPWRCLPTRHHHSPVWDPLLMRLGV